nr:hypothetical protein [Tanacetum cinerariifolium]
NHEYCYDTFETTEDATRAYDDMVDEQGSSVSLILAMEVCEREKELATRAWKRIAVVRPSGSRKGWSALMCPTSAAIDEPIDTFVDGVIYALSNFTTPLSDPFITPLKVPPEMLAAGEDCLANCLAYRRKSLQAIRDQHCRERQPMTNIVANLQRGVSICDDKDDQWPILLLTWEEECRYATTFLEILMMGNDSIRRSSARASGN